MGEVVLVTVVKCRSDKSHRQVPSLEAGLVSSCFSFELLTSDPAPPTLATAWSTCTCTYHLRGNHLHGDLLYMVTVGPIPSQ